MGLDRGFGDFQGVGDLFVGLTLGHAFQHLQLLAGQGLEQLRRETRGVVHPPVRTGSGRADNVRRQVDVAVENLLDRIGHLAAGRRFGDEAHRAVSDGLQDDLLVLLGGHDHHRNGRCFVAQVDQAIEPVHAGHVQVEQDQVQVIVFLGQGQGAVQVGGFHHFAAGKAVADDVMDGFAKQRVIIGNQNFVHSLSPHYFDYGVATTRTRKAQGKGSGRAGVTGRLAACQASTPSRYQYSVL